jgi:hypothetical protein
MYLKGESSYMDRRMYRGVTGNNNGYNRGGSTYKSMEPVCGDVVSGYVPEDMYERNGFDDNQERFPIGMCYVPWQRFRNLYDNEFQALANGTLFKELDLDWYGRGCK